jgi:hypothetical protein
MADTPDLGSGSARSGGSSPLARTTFIGDFEENGFTAQIPHKIEQLDEKPNVRFPKIIRYRRIEATIYGKTKNYPFYRLVYYVAGKRVTRSFKSFGEAKTEAERLVREIADGSQAAALTGEQSRDALAALERLESFRQSTGRRISLLAAVSDHVAVLEKLNGRSPSEAVEGFLQIVASIKPKDVCLSSKCGGAMTRHGSSRCRASKADMKVLPNLRMPSSISALSPVF